ncbi:O-antigen ligase family protein [Leptospira sp. WS92.C1]
MSQYLNLKIIPIFALIPCLSLLYFFDPFNPALSKDFIVFSFFVWICCIGIAAKKKIKRIHPLFLLACLLLIGLSTINGINRAPVVYFPQKVNLKILYAASLVFTIFLFFKNVHPIFLFAHTVLFSCSPPLFSSIKSVPLLIFIFASFFYLAPKKIRLNKLQISIVAFFILVLLSSILSYKSQSSLLQLCLILSSILIFFLISSYPNRSFKKGLLLILSFNLVVNVINLLSAIHTVWPFSIWEPPIFLTYVGFPVSAVAVISALTSFVAFYTATQYKSYAWFLIPGSIFSFYLTFLNQSRASLLALVAAILIFFILRLGKKNYVFKIIFPVSCILILIGGLFFVSDEFVTRYANSETLLIRFSLWAFHFQSVLENSPIIGLGLEADSLLAHLPGINPERIGYNDFSSFLHSFRSYPQAHNLYVETFTSLGFLGVFLFIGTAWNLICSAYQMLVSKQKETLDLGIFVLGIIVFIAVHELFDFNLGEQHFLIPATFCIALIRTKRETKLGFLKLDHISFRIAYTISFVSVFFLSFQLSWEQRLRNLILASSQNEIELDNFLIYKEKTIVKKQRKNSYPIEEILQNKFWIRSDENLVLASLLLRKYPEQISLAESFLEKCVQNNPYSSVCWKEKAEILKNQIAHPDLKQNLENAKKTDPFHIVITE